ncbi:MAG: hypothetical protein ACFFCS_11980 [Candidatus Hodarchaeota archaeon]
MFERLRKWLENNWFLLYGIIVILVFFIDIFWGILLIIFGVLFGVFLSLLKRRGKAKLSKNLLGFDKINERELARISGMYIEEAHSFLHDVSRDPNSSGISILVKGQYIYFSNKIIKKFKELYKEGKRTKELIAEMPQFETKVEVSKMLEKLREFDELPGWTSKEKKEEEELIALDQERKMSPRLNKLVLACELIGVILALFSLANFVSRNWVITSRFDEYHDWMETSTWCMGFGVISIWISWGILTMKRKYLMTVLLGITIALGLGAVLYVNNGRPDMLDPAITWTESIFNSFKMLVVYLEIGAIGSTALAMAVVFLKEKK